MGWPFDGPWRGAAPGKERLLEERPCSAFRDEPAADTFGDLTGRGLGQLGGVFAILANPISLPNRLAEQLDAMRAPTAFFQANADVSRQSGHSFDPSEIGTTSQVLRYENSPYTDETEANRASGMPKQEFDPLNVATSSGMVEYVEWPCKIGRRNRRRIRHRVKTILWPLG